MAKTGQPAWAKRILKLLEQAKEKDRDLVRFGAHSHQYKLSAPASEEAIRTFEEQQGIRRKRSRLSRASIKWREMEGMETAEWFCGIIES